MTAPSSVLHLGDCLDVMADMPDGSVDMVLADLPYGTTRNKWDSQIPLEPLWAHYWRVLKTNGVVALTASQPFTSVLVASCPRHFRYDWVWLKQQGTGYLNAQRAPLRTHESILVFSQHAPPYYPQQKSGPAYRRSPARQVTPNYGRHTDLLRVVNGGRCPTTDLYFPRDSERRHPTQKPVALFAYLIRTYTNPGDVVLDNCAGSGTTAVACIQEGRRYICIEKEPSFFSIAEQRIAQARAAVAPLPLFTEEAS